MNDLIQFQLFMFIYEAAWIYIIYVKDYRVVRSGVLFIQWISIKMCLVYIENSIPIRIFYVQQSNNYHKINWNILDPSYFFFLWLNEILFELCLPLTLHIVFLKKVIQTSCNCNICVCCVPWIYVIGENEDWLNFFFCKIREKNTFSNIEKDKNLNETIF